MAATGRRVVEPPDAVLNPSVEGESKRTLSESRPRAGIRTKHSWLPTSSTYLSSPSLGVVLPVRSTPVDFLTPPYHDEEVEMDGERQQPERTKGPGGNSMTTDASLAVGIAIGVAIGAAMDNIAIGIAIGGGIGVALGASFESARKRDSNSEHD